LIGKAFIPAIGDLPPQLAALNRTNINVQELAVRALWRKIKQTIPGDSG